MAFERIKASMKKGMHDVEEQRERERVEKELDQRFYNALKASRERAETEQGEKNPSQLWRMVGGLQERSRPIIKGGVRKTGEAVRSAGKAAAQYAQGIGERQVSYERAETQRLKEIAKQQKIAMSIQRVAQNQQRMPNRATPQGGDWSGASEMLFGNSGGNNASQELFGGNGGGSASQNLFGGRKGRSASQDLFGLK